MQLITTRNNITEKIYNMMPITIIIEQLFHIIKVIIRTYYSYYE